MLDKKYFSAVERKNYYTRSSMRFFFEGPPIPKARHRSRVVGRHVISYDPQDKEKKKIKQYVLNEINENNLSQISDGPIAVSVLNYVPIPQSLSNKRRDELDGQYCDKRPDVDNYVKWIFDILNKLSYRDDGQIAWLLSKKVYSKSPRMEIELTKLDDTPTQHGAQLNARPTEEQIVALIQKANLLGLQQRVICNAAVKKDGSTLKVSYESVL